MNEVPCLDCEGIGQLIFPFKKLILPCERCNSTGKVPEIQLKWAKTGNSYKLERIKRRELLRDAAIRMNVDVMLLSAAERGCIDPKTVFPTPVKCKHEKIIEWHGERKCGDCKKPLDGWFCPDNAPTHECVYSESDDWCDHCGEPEERK